MEAQIQIEEVNNNLTYFPYKRKKKSTWKNPFSPFLCKIGLQLLVVVIVAASYGTFTNGMPDPLKYEYILGASHNFGLQLAGVFGLVYFLMEIFQTTWNKLANSLHRKIPLCWIVFGLIITYIAKVGYFHTL